MNRTIVCPSAAVFALSMAAFAQNFTVVENNEWKPVDMQNLAVEAGSALDFARFFPAEPAGAHGRVIVNKDGNFGFEKKPER